MLLRCQKRIQALLSGSFAKNVSILVGGTAFSQLIGLLALPFLTRIYSPDDFSVLAVYTSLLTLISVIACLRFEIAIPLPKKNKDAVALLLLSFGSVCIITILTIIGVALFSEQLNKATEGKLIGYLWIIPIGVFLAGIYNALQYWSTRQRNFSLIAKTRMTQSISGNGVQLSLGYLGVGSLGLLLGQLLNVGAGIWGLGRYLLKNHFRALKNISFNRIKRTCKQYDRFPKYSTWEAFANAGSIQLPIILIAYYAAGPEVGFIMLAMRLLSSPLRLIGGAVSQVYLAEGANKYHQGTLKTFTYQTILNLAKVGTIPLLLAGIFAPFVIPFIFGAEWDRAGILISWMVPWFFLQFITSPISMALHITNSQKVALTLQLFGFCLRTGTVVLAGIYYNNLIGEYYAISGLFFYSLYLLLVLYVIRKY